MLQICLLEVKKVSNIKEFDRKKKVIIGDSGKPNDYQFFEYNNFFDFMKNLSNDDLFSDGQLDNVFSDNPKRKILLVAMREKILNMAENAISLTILADDLEELFTAMEMNLEFDLKFFKIAEMKPNDRKQLFMMMAMVLYGHDSFLYEMELQWKITIAVIIQQVSNELFDGQCVSIEDFVMSSRVYILPHIEFYDDEDELW